MNITRVTVSIWHSQMTRQKAKKKTSHLVIYDSGIIYEYVCVIRSPVEINQIRNCLVLVDFSTCNQETCYRAAFFKKLLTFEFLIRLFAIETLRSFNRSKRLLCWRCFFFDCKHVHPNMELGGWWQHRHAIAKSCPYMQGYIFRCAFCQSEYCRHHFSSRRSTFFLFNFLCFRSPFVIVVVWGGEQMNGKKRTALISMRTIFCVFFSCSFSRLIQGQWKQLCSATARSHQDDSHTANTFSVRKQSATEKTMQTFLHLWTSRLLWFCFVFAFALFLVVLRIFSCYYDLLLCISAFGFCLCTVSLPVENNTRFGYEWQPVIHKAVL